MDEVRKGKIEAWEREGGKRERERDNEKENIEAWEIRKSNEI